MYSVRIGSEVMVRKHPIEEHPWNIAVFHEGNEVGTLTAQRIKHIHGSFPEEGMSGKVIFLLRDKWGNVSQMKIRIRAE